jgi:hypothetical protein
MVTYVVIYLGLVFLKLIRFPLVREIEWKWFILVPLFYFLWKVFGRFLVWVIYLVITCGILYGIAQAGIWLFSL